MTCKSGPAPDKLVQMLPKCVWQCWSRKSQEALAAVYVPLSFDPGEAYQFDWRDEIVLIDGATMTVKVARVRLTHRRMPFVRAHPRETQVMVFDAHGKALVFFVGLARGVSMTM